MKPYIKLMRVRHYIKNVLIALPIFFSGNIFHLNTIIDLLFGIISFSLLSSCIYIINDIADVNSDRSHPIKKNRPLASGAISMTAAKIQLLILIGIIIILQFVSNHTLFQSSSLFLVIYFILNILYSFKLKNLPIIDIVILSSGFLIRILYGGAIAHVGISKWLFLTVLTISLYIAFGKRWGELRQSKERNIPANETRPVLKFYTEEFLKTNMLLCLTLTIVFYSLWSSVFSNNPFITDDPMILTVPLVLIICILYSYLIDKNSYADPIDVFYSSKILVILVVIYIVSVFSIIYILK